ncbi:hypothetical protein Y032_0042g504 [Ancylostoma ceylanicum]|uniref:Uncharacterized protein n=1 Tax=Ancylostoma ceylanicum TaxID=53326 RepID=A0A016UF17_9BILA|nr:hypothetical protein Y032_0042g504 [Ancylostoma ceylanicum]
MALSGGGADTDYFSFSIKELTEGIFAMNTNPEVAKMFQAFLKKIPIGFTSLQDEERSRTIVISGIEELGSGCKATERQAHVEGKVNEVFDALDIECRPVTVFRLGKWDGARPRLVKVVLPSKTHWATALANAYRLRSTGLANIHIRRSMTLEERRREFQLRQEARELNKGLPHRQWVVYKGELKKVSDLPARQIPGNFGPPRFSA